MNNESHSHVCPVEKAGGLDNSIRRFLQNPHKLLVPFVKPGMSVLDLGCGPGFFSLEMATLLNGSGKVIAADLQDGMLEKVVKKISGTPLEKIIKTHKCLPDTIGLTEKVDFVLAFYMVHEVPDKDKLFGELRSILNVNGQVFIVEPKFHVSGENFDNMLNLARNHGFRAAGTPKIFFSRAVLLTI